MTGFKVGLEWDEDGAWDFVISGDVDVHGLIYPATDAWGSQEVDHVRVYGSSGGNIHQLAEAFALLAKKYAVAELSRLGQEQVDSGIEPAKERYRKNSHWHDVYVGPCECGAWHRAGDMDDVRAEQGK